MRAFIKKLIRFFLRKVESFKNKVNKAFCRLVYLLPASKNYIMLESEGDFCENARAIYEYLINHNLNDRFHIIWSVKDPQKYKAPHNVVFIRLDDSSIRWNYYLSRCKYFIFTHPYWLKKWKPSQLVINSGHGNPFKGVATKLPHVCDCVLASSEDGIKYRKNEYEEDIQVDVLGAPRVDWLFEKGDFLAPFISREYKKIVFCMPTYKKSELGTDSNEDYRYGINTIHSVDELTEFNEFLIEKEVLLVFFSHHLQVLSDYESIQQSNLLFLRDSDYSKYGYVMNQLLTCADALITDYSSVFIEYLLLDRPIAFFCNSVSDYTRGFAVDNPLDYMAGAKLYNTDDLKSFIIDVIEEKDDYQKERLRVRDLCHKYQDNNNCERFLKYYGII